MSKKHSINIKDDIQFESKRQNRTPCSGSKKFGGFKLRHTVKETETTKITAVGSGPKTSWKVNLNIQNLEELKRSGVDREIKKRARLVKNRIRSRRLIKFLGVLSVLVAMYFVIGYRSRTFKLSTDVEQGSKYSKELTEDIKNRLEGGVFNFFVPPLTKYGNLIDEFKESREELADVQFKFNYLKMKTEVLVTTSAPLVKWSSGNGQTVYVNSAGKVFSPPASFVGIFKPVELAGSGLEERSGEGGGLSDKLIWAVGVIKIMKQQGHEPVRLEMSGGSLKRVEVFLAGESQTRLIFSTAEDVERSGESAARVVKYFWGAGGDNLKNIGYLDFRTPDRVVYK